MTVRSMDERFMDATHFLSLFFLNLPFVGHFS